MTEKIEFPADYSSLLGAVEALTIAMEVMVSRNSQHAIVTGIISEKLEHAVADPAMSENRRSGYLRVTKALKG